jgi:hypothetical protein
VAIASSTADWISAIAAVAVVVIAVGGVVARWLLRRRRGPTTRTADEVAAERRSAYAQFDGTLLEIVEAIKQFDPSGPSAGEDLNTLRALNRTLVKDGKGRMRRAFGEQSAIVRIEREIRYGVTRSIQILDSRQSRSGLSDHAVMDRPEPWLVLEHAQDLLRTNVDVAQRRPHDVLTHIEGPISFWDELQRFASPAH